MDSQFAAICRPSACSMEAWLFRKVFKAGSVVPNAIASADVDEDGQVEILIGSTEGVFAILKPNRRTTLLSVAVPGTVSALCYSNNTAYIVCMEGVLTVFPSLSECAKSNGGGSAEVSKAASHLSKSVIVPANTTCIDVCGQWLVLGSSDRKVHLIDIDTFSHVRSYFIGSQVFSLATFEVWVPAGEGSSSVEGDEYTVGYPLPFIFAAGTAHLALIDPRRFDPLDPTSGPYEWRFKVDRSRFRKCNSEARLVGGESSVSLVHQVNPALPICAAALGSDTGSDCLRRGPFSYISAATEDGYCYLFSVVASLSPTQGGENNGSCLSLHVDPLWTTSTMESDQHVNMMPSDGLKLSGGAQRIFMYAPSVGTTRAGCAVVILCSSGEVSVIDNQKGLLRSQLVPNACAFGFMGVQPGDTIGLAVVTTDEITCFRVPCAALGTEGCVVSESKSRSGRGSLQHSGGDTEPEREREDGSFEAAVPSFMEWEDLVSIGRAMFPSLRDQSDSFVAQRAMRSLLFGYSLSEWEQLRTCAEEKERTS